MASFFLITLAFNSCAWADQKYNTDLLQHLSQKKEWSMLLHAPKNKSFIQDPKFFLHPTSFDKYQELVATLQAFSDSELIGNNHALCRFPARYLWLKKQLALQDEDYPSPNCSNYQTFKKKVPVDEVQLVFASENVISPSSMMGHTFLKLSGTTENDYHAEHAVTYFTVLDSLNVPKIVYQNFAGGMPGVFALQPYQKMKKNYLEKEKRNLWEYTVPLNDSQISLLQAHIWELKDLTSDYLFGNYNCATLTYFLLALNAPEILEDDLQWISPVDVVKLAKKYKLITQTNVITSAHWKIQMLLGKVDDASLVKQNVQNLELNDVPSFAEKLSPAEKLLALSYLHYLHSNDNETYAGHEEAYQQLDYKLSNMTDEYRLDYASYKDPSKVPGNQQVQLSLGRQNNNEFLGVSFLPAANRITDDQRQYSSARELRMAELNIRLYKKGQLKVHDFTLYAVRSLTPWDEFTRSLSGQWRMSFENHFDSLLNTHLVFNLAGGLGYTVALDDDVNVSALYNIGAASNTKKTYLYHYPEVILQINEIWDMKTTLSYKSHFNMYGSSFRNDTYNACQSYYPKQNITFLACFESVQNKNKQIEEFSLSIQKHF